MKVKNLIWSFNINLIEAKGLNRTYWLNPWGKDLYRAACTHDFTGDTIFLSEGIDIPTAKSVCMFHHIKTVVGTVNEFLEDI